MAVRDNSGDHRQYALSRGFAALDALEAGVRSLPLGDPLRQKLTLIKEALASELEEIWSGAPAKRPDGRSDVDLLEKLWVTAREGRPA